MRSESITHLKLKVATLLVHLRDTFLGVFQGYVHPRQLLRLKLNLIPSDLLAFLALARHKHLRYTEETNLRVQHEGWGMLKDCFENKWYFDKTASVLVCLTAVSLFLGPLGAAHSRKGS